MAQAVQAGVREGAGADVLIVGRGAASSKPTSVEPPPAEAGGADACGEAVTEAAEPAPGCGCGGARRRRGGRGAMRDEAEGGRLRPPDPNGHDGSCSRRGWSGTPPAERRSGCLVTGRRRLRRRVRLLQGVDNRFGAPK